MKSIDYVIEKIVSQRGNKIDEYGDGTGVYEFRSKKNAIIITQHRREGEITSVFLEYRGELVYAARRNNKEYKRKRDVPGKWKSIARNLIQTSEQLELSLN
jgi:hypothetical protein